MIGSHKSTISRELHRNRGQRVYRPRQAHFKTISRRYHRRARIGQDPWELIEAELRLDWIPEQIIGWLGRTPVIRVSHEWIYQYILMNKLMVRNLFRHLRCQKKRRKCYGGYDRCGQSPNRVSIEHRLIIVQQRQRIGDWEVDTIVGKRHHQMSMTLMERKSHFALLRKVEQRAADQVTKAIVVLLKPVSDGRQTLTSDNEKSLQIMNRSLES